MEETTSKEKMLKSIRNALIHKSVNPFPGLDLESPIYVPATETPDLTFAEEFTKVNGQFVYCEDIPALIENLKLIAIEQGWTNVFTFDSQLDKVLDKARVIHSTNKDDFANLKVAVTFCENLVARVGSIVISSRQTAGRKLNIFPEVHVVVAMTSQIVPDIQHAIKRLREKYEGRLPSMISFITGPSLTAGIEPSLTQGGQGPREVFVFLVDDSPIIS